MLKNPYNKISNALQSQTWPPQVMLFCIYWLLAFAVYIKAHNAELVDDGFAGLLKLKHSGWAAFSHSFGFTSLYYFHDIFVLGTYMLVGKSSLAWFIVMLTFHSLNATLAFMVFQKFYVAINVKRATGIALLGSLLFLLSPYQTENVVWAATLHYGIALCVLFIVAHLILQAISVTGFNTCNVLTILCLYSVSLMTLEISLVFPFAWLCLGIPVAMQQKSLATVKQLMIQLLLPLLAAIALYFITTRLVKGHWIPHYGATHLANNTLQNYSTSVARYITKLISYIHFADYTQRAKVYEFCLRWKVMLAIELGFVTAVIATLYLLRRKTVIVAFIAITLLALILLFPSLQMYFMYLFTPENDRLGYFFSVAFYQLVPMLLLQLPVLASVCITAAYLLTGTFFLQKQVNKWHEAGVLHARCIQSFVWTDAPRVYVLNSPTNYNGAYVFRNNDRLPYALDFFKDYKDKNRIAHVLSSTYGTLSDSAIVTIENDSTLYVSLQTNGGWLMNEFLGATDYKTNDFTVDVDEWYPAYRVVFHNKEKGAVFIYGTGKGFYKVEGF